MSSIAQAIKAINPDAQFSYVDEDYSTIEWLNGTEPISLKDIEAKKPEVEAKNVAEAKAKADAKQSALDKLVALGLTEEEALALGVK